MVLTWASTLAGVGPNASRRVGASERVAPAVAAGHLPPAVATALIAVAMLLVLMLAGLLYPVQIPQEDLDTYLLGG